jgi:fatty-acyl-CoA synthase
MIRVAVLADKLAAEREMPVTERWRARSLFEQLVETAAAFADRPAIRFQITSGPSDKSVTLTWADLRREVTRAANLFRRLGIGEKDTVAYVLPNGLEAPVTLLAGATAGIVNPVNPLLHPEHMAGILRETGAKVVVTLAPFPKSDVAQKVAAAAALAPGVRTILEVDLARYLDAPKKWLVPFLRPRRTGGHTARVLDYHAALARENAEGLDFDETLDDRICAYFHTGGTTGMPKIAQHRASGILYNGWLGKAYIFRETDALMCPVPMFHVLAAYPVFMSCLMTGAAIIYPTPQGYRGAGVMDNFWKLVERYRATFMIVVPTAAAALMQRKVDADLSSLQLAISGSAAMPVELFRRFEAAAGVTILEGYGVTETTCLISINPPHGERRIGSVGLPFPYTDVRILDCAADGNVNRECAADEIGEICVKNPGVGGTIYLERDMNRGLLTPDGYLRTGDLGRLDAEGYIWITGRAKDLIIRGGHNIDPAMIEDAFLQHPAVAFAGAVGEPDAKSGEMPAVYVELVTGAEASVEELAAHAASHIPERAAVPRHVEILDELPKTAVGKVFKPDLRRRAITRTLDEALRSAGAASRVAAVEEDKRRGLVARVSRGRDAEDDATAGHVLGQFTIAWEWSTSEPSKPA